MALLCKMWEKNLDGWIGFWISNKMALGGRYSSNESIYNDFYLHCLIKYKLMLQHYPSGACLSSWQPIFIKLYMTKIIEIINEIKRIMKVEWPLATPVTWLPNSYFLCGIVCIVFWLFQKSCLWVAENANQFLIPELWIVNERILGYFPDSYYFENWSC